MPPTEALVLSLKRIKPGTECDNSVIVKHTRVCMGVAVLTHWPLKNTSLLNINSRQSQKIVFVPESC